MSTPQEVFDDITIKTYKKSAEENAFQSHMLWGLLKEKGGIDREDGGTGPTWPVHGGWHSVYTVSDYEDIASKYVPNKQHFQATLPWGEKLVVDVLTAGTIRQNRGQAALVKWRDKQVPAMYKSLLTQGSASIAYDFVNADGTGTGSPLYGLASIFKSFGYNVTTKEAVMGAATYGGKSLVAGAVGAELDAAADNYIWTPRGVNEGSTKANSGWVATTFAASACLAMMDYLQSVITFDPTDEMYKPDCGMTTKARYLVIKEAIDSAEQIQLVKPADGSLQWGTGSSFERLHRNGLPIYWDPHCRTGELYMLNFDQIKLVGLNPIEDVNGTGVKMSASGEDDGLPTEFAVVWDEDRRAFKMSVTFPGQFIINPRYQGILTDFSAAARA